MDKLGNARLADPGLHSVLANSPLIVSRTMNIPYRWTAPELLKNSSTKPTIATDVYSVTMTSLVICFHIQLVRIIVDRFPLGNLHGEKRGSFWT
jgi:protein tyrosine kinase